MTISNRPALHVATKNQHELAAGKSAPRLLALQTLLSASVLFISYIVISDADVTLNLPLSALPLLSLKITTRTYLILASLAVFVSFLYFHIVLHRLTSVRNVSFGENDVGSVWIFSDLVYSYLRPKQPKLHGWWAEKLFAWMLVWVLPVQAQYSLFDSGIGFHNWIFTGWQLSFIFATILMCFFYFCRSRQKLIFKILFGLYLLWASILQVSDSILSIDAPLDACTSHGEEQSNWAAEPQDVLRSICNPKGTLNGNVASRFISNSSFYVRLFGYTASFPFVRRDPQLNDDRLSRYESDVPTGSGYSIYLKSAAFYHMNLRNAVLADSFLKDADIQRTDLSGSNADGADLDGASISQSNIDLAVWNAAKLQRISFDDSKMIGANFTFSDLSGANFNGSMNSNGFIPLNLDGVDFESTILHCAHFFAVRATKNTNFLDADMSNTMFRLSDFYNATTLTQGALSNSCADLSIFPPGITLPPCSTKYFEICRSYLPQQAVSLLKTEGDLR